MEQAPSLSTPEEELAYLREQVAHKEAELALRQSSGQADEPHRGAVFIYASKQWAVGKLFLEGCRVPAEPSVLGG